MIYLTIKKPASTGSSITPIPNNYLFLFFLSLFREVNHHRKKLTGRKLDFDCKKRQGAGDEDIRKAEEKFAESLHLAQLGMHNLLDGSGVEHISQLTQFSEVCIVQGVPYGWGGL